MSKGWKISRLGIELGLAAVISAAAGLALYIGLNTFGYGLLDQNLMREDVLAAKEQEYADSLQTYVMEHGISSENIRALDEWAGEKKNFIVTLYKDRTMIYCNDGRVAVTVSHTENWEGENPEPDSDHKESGQNGETAIPWVYRLQLSDGSADAVFSFLFDPYYYGAVNAVSGLVAVLVSMTLLLLFIHGKVQYIAQLEREIQILQGGDLDYAITVSGRDELASLAAEMNAMRLAIKERQEQEERARNANRELVTAMSHDLRTPLTSLLGYVDILQMDRCGNGEQMKKCLSAVKDKAYQIKEMSDQMFEYFIVYGKDEEEVELTEVNGAEFLGQIVEESLFDLENEGFLIERESDEISCRLMTDIRLVRRVFGNVFSNLLKYADRSRPVRVEYRQTEQALIIRFANSVCREAEQKESSNIGLKTCEKIMSCHRGKFSCRREGEQFLLELEFPIREKRS